MYTYRILPVLVFTAAMSLAGEELPAPDTPETIEKWWKAGVTLPVGVSARYPIGSIRVRNDTGINVLVDMAHKCDFFLLWNLPGQLHRRGIRSAGSHATLDTMLTPGEPCRVRIPVAAKVHPFAWWPVPRWNVILTESEAKNPGYLPEEREALRSYIKGGGGLIVSGSRLRPGQEETWSLNVLLADYGAAVLSDRQRYEGQTYPALKVDDEWEVVLKGEGGRPVYARRRFGKGRIVLLGSSGFFRFDRRNRADTSRKGDFLASVITWAAAGSPPVGGEPRLPTPMAGGGGIYQESELRLDGIVCYYSKNQTPELLRTVREDFPHITEDLYAWCPSPRPEQPMYLILCSGGGGGWAVNAYLPKEASTISTSPAGIRSIFAHEQAHTMSGPCKAANHPFGGNQGEEHAGWFQGKINAKYNGDTGPNRGCQKVLRRDYDGTPTRPGEIFRARHLETWRTGWDRLMIWYVWQKLDDRYGPTWYPRWRWVQGERWKDTPSKTLTWEEAIEDMSIAVGEDLFPFFKKTGKELARDRFETVEFKGATLTLPIASIEPTAPGNVCLDPIADYTKPIEK